MQCEVLAFKPVAKGRVAVVRAVQKPDLIGELPVASGCTLEVGQIGVMKSKVASRAGRLTVLPYLENA